MNVNNNIKTDYSALFNSLSSSSSNSGTGIESLLSDYNSIKSGTYGKLMKSYYAKNASSSDKTSGTSSSTTASDDTSARISKLQSTSKALSESAAALYQNNSDSVFKSEDKDEIYKAVSSFVKDYNSAITTAAESDNSKIVRSASNLANTTAIYSKQLSNMGITIGTDNKLSIDEAAFKKADTSSVKAVFNGTGSLAYQAGTSASFINMYATQDAGKASGLYTQGGIYSSPLSTGDIYNSIF